jgi:hypothetical protein
MNTSCLAKAIEQAQRTYEHVYVVVPDERWQGVLTETAAMLHGRATSTGRTWLFPDAPEHKGGMLTVVPVSEDPPKKDFTLSPCGWGVVDARPISKWRTASKSETTWA